LTTCWEETSRVLIGAKMLLDPAHPMNAGTMRSFHVVAPAGSIVMGVPPTSNSNHSDVAAAMATLSLKLFSEMLPERGVGSDGKTGAGHVFGGIDQRPGREGTPFGFIVMGGLGWGGTSTTDGISFCATPIFGVSCPVFELMERDNPIILRGLNAALDTAGAGRFRAGHQNAMMIELTGDVAWTMVLDSTRFTRPGAAGGGSGMASLVFRVRREADGRIPYANGLVPLENLEPLVGLFDEDGSPDPAGGTWNQGTTLQTAKVSNVPLKAGDVLYAIPAAGGGYGDPLERDVELVRRDVRNELVSIAAAADLYGVKMDSRGLDVDSAASASIRSAMRERREQGAEIPIAFPRPWPRTAGELRGDPQPPAPVGSAAEER
jgi:N-methylhydantoinase B